MLFQIINEFEYSPDELTLDEETHWELLKEIKNSNSALLSYLEDYYGDNIIYKFAEFSKLKRELYILSSFYSENSHEKKFITRFLNLISKAEMKETDIQVTTL
jgi:hypothetical protein